MGRRECVSAVLAWGAVALLAACPGGSADVGDGSDADAAVERDVEVGDATAPGDRDASGEVDGGDDRRVVSTTEGPVRGVRRREDRPVWSFLGIPYAEPPVGGRRWQPPRDPDPREEILEADSFGPACPQPPSSMVLDAGPTSEDCLTLNVWTPEVRAEARLPVMIWLHGGGFIQGSSGLAYPGGGAIYSGRRLAARGVVVVSLNYRLGPLGFFSHPRLGATDESGAPVANFGFLDQVAALEWVRDNIDRFGGDPDRVTLFGESAGGISVCGHMVSSKSRGLFDGAIVQSGGCPSLMRRLNRSVGRLDSARTQGRQVASAVGCDPKDLACLRSKSASEIVDALDLTISFYGEGETFGPVAGGATFSKTMWSAVERGEMADVPVIAGMTADEGTIFARQHKGATASDYRTWVSNRFPGRSTEVRTQYPVDDYTAPWRAIAAIVGDLVVRCPTRWLLRARAADGAPTWGYLFSHVPPYGARNDLGAYHGAELPFVFKSFARPVVPREEAILADRIQQFWIEFARGGNPGTVGGRTWARYGRAADALLEFRTPRLETHTGFRREACSFWASQGL